MKQSIDKLMDAVDVSDGCDCIKAGVKCTCLEDARADVMRLVLFDATVQSMKVRDVFAAFALMGMESGGLYKEFSPEQRAESAFLVANEMMCRRRKK